MYVQVSFRKNVFIKTRQKRQHGYFKQKKWAYGVAQMVEGSAMSELSYTISNGQADQLYLCCGVRWNPYLTVL